MTVVAPPADCDIGYAQDKTYDIRLDSSAALSGVTLGAVRVDSETGAFQTSFTIPADFPIGEAGLTFLGSRLEECNDIGSCPTLGTSISITG